MNNLVPSRRQLLAALAAYPLLGMRLDAFGAEETKKVVGLSQDAVLINNRPRFLLGGTMDYFRCPNELWRDRLLKAKRGGLNAIGAYVAWNVHEAEEGVYDFTRDRDLPRFLDLCNELDLLVFLRPGPFICDEWEAGGYPAWLIGRPEAHPRDNDPATNAAVRRWFEQLFPHVVSRQVTRGGAIALVQQENEYFFVGRPGAQEYQDFLIRAMRELGIDVPITDCNGFNKEIRRPQSLMTYNGWNPNSASRLHHEQPGKPVIVSEFYTDWINLWGDPPSDKYPPTLVQRQTFECLSLAAMPFYFTYHGGTSFGFNGSCSSDGKFVPPSYYGLGPICQGGALTDMYFALKAALQPARSLEDLLAGSEVAKLPVALDKPAHGAARRGKRGTLMFLFNNTPQNKSTLAATMAFTLPSGRRIELASDPSIPAILPFDLQINADQRIDFANAPLVAVSSDAVVISGDAGRPGIISVNGQPTEFTFSDDVQVFKPGGAIVLAVPTTLAPRTWLADGRIIIGPAYVGEKRGQSHECWRDAQTQSIRVLQKDGSLQTTAAPSTTAPSATTAPSTQIRFTDWRGCGCSEMRADLPEKTGDWRDLDAPTHVENLHAYQGYTWYRAKYSCDQPRQSSLMFTEAADRIHVFHNGRRIGVFGAGVEATRDPLPLQLVAGENRFVFLCDNMGRSSEGTCLDRKGIGGPVHVDTLEPRLQWTQASRPSKPPTQSWRFLTYQSRMKTTPLSRWTASFTPPAGHRLIVAIRSMPQFAWVSINGKPIGEHGGALSLVDGTNFSTYIIEPLGAGQAMLEVVAAGDALSQIDDRVRLFAAPLDQTLSGWSFRQWSAADGNEPVQPDYPACWRTTFAKPALAGPLFLELDGLSKGHAYLNGRALGRYWHIGPQKNLYLPEPWIKEQNELVVFDEAGSNPSEIHLTRDERCPTQMVLI